MPDVIDNVQIESTLSDLRCRVEKCVSESEFLPTGAARQPICRAAQKWIVDLAAAIDRQSGSWLDPTITDNDDNQVVFEWWRGDKKLISRVGSESVELVKRWGARTARKREEILSPSMIQIRDCWTWLTHDER